MPFTPSIVERLLARIGQPALTDLLTAKVTGNELNTILLDVFDRRVSNLKAPDLLRHYERNRFVKPADLPVIESRQMEIDVLRIFEQAGYSLMDLSPLSSLGSCSVLGPVDQKKVITALRGTEVLADATNAIALDYCYHRKKKQSAVNAKFASIQRHVRAQQISGKGFTPHFRIACLVTCGRDSGNYAFEMNAMAEHMDVMIHLYRRYYKVRGISFRLICRKGCDDPDRLAGAIRAHVLSLHPGVPVTIVKDAGKENNYYKGIQYKVDIEIHGKQYEIGDGGFVDWTQRLLQDRKERMLSTGIGFDFMLRILRGEL